MASAFVIEKRCGVVRVKCRTRSCPGHPEYRSGALVEILKDGTLHFPEAPPLKQRRTVQPDGPLPSIGLKDGELVSLAPTTQEVIQGRKLSFRHLNTLSEVADDAKAAEEAADDAADAAWFSARAAGNTANAVSLTCSGPTSSRACRTLYRALSFMSACTTCASKDPVPINALMPTFVDGVKQDYCYDCFRRFDALTKMIQDIWTSSGPDPTTEAGISARHTITDVLRMVGMARKAIGKARLDTVSKSYELLRIISGDDASAVAIGGGYYCQECKTQPKNDFHWTKVRNCGNLSGWFCANKGCAYDHKRRAGLSTFVDKKDPAASFVLNTKMPTGEAASMLSAVKIVNLIRTGEFPESIVDVAKAGSPGIAIKAIIQDEGDRYYRLFSKLRYVERKTTISRPNAASAELCPEMVICENEDDVTLGEKDFGGCHCSVYDVGTLFSNEEPADPTDDAWRAVINAVLETWTLAEACSIDPESLHTWTGLKKSTCTALQMWTYIRAIGKHAPRDGLPVRPASASELEWAAAPFEGY